MPRMIVVAGVISLLGGGAGDRGQGASSARPTASPTSTAPAKSAPSLEEGFAMPRSAPAATQPVTCALGTSGSDSASTQECLRCHSSADGPVHGNHPVDLDYAAAEGEAGRSGTLRPIGEVVRRGVLLPDGKLQCVTCHDARSPWAAKIALPPGSVAAPALNPRNPSTYEDRDGLRTTGPGAQLPPPGTAVSSSPLCIACHALD